MAWKRKHVLLVLTWLVSLAIANYLGGVVGFGQGYRTQSALSARDAVVTVTVLRVLRGGRSSEAIQLLETQLDTQIAADVFGEHAYHSPYNVSMRFVFGERPVRNDAYFLSEVLKYREEYPPVSGDASVNAKLMRALSAYRDAPKP